MKTHNIFPEALVASLDILLRLTKSPKPQTHLVHSKYKTCPHGREAETKTYFEFLLKNRFNNYF